MSSLVIQGGTLIDGTGTEPVQNASVVVEGSVIKEVGPKNSTGVPAGARIIDASGKTIMPGLIDSHLHLIGWRTDSVLGETITVPEGVQMIRASKDAQSLLEAGFTTVKDCASTHALHIRRAIAEGTIPGPRIIAAGYFLSQTYGHGEFFHTLPLEVNDARTYGRGFTLLCDGVDECMKAARYSLREGADFIKIGTSGGILSERDNPDQAQFTIEEIKAVVQVAKNAGTFVTAHCQSTAGMHNSVDAGVKTIDHAFNPDEYVIEEGMKRGIIFVPTLSIAMRILEGGVKAGYPAWAVKKTQDVWDNMIAKIKWLHDSGATMASATDFIGSPLTKMGTNALELELLVKHCGFTHMEAITAATLNGARACGLEKQTGSIEKGKQADILVVDGDPRADIRLLQETQRIRTVIKDGAVAVQR